MSFKITGALRNNLISKSNTKTFVRGDVTESNQVIESCKNSYTCEGGTRKVLATANNNFPMDIDVSWLKAASQTYEISPDINDYLVVDVMAVSIPIPNRNTQAFPFEEISYFDYAYGMMIYQTFIGKPSCADHANQVDENPNLAKGVIFASVLQYVPRYHIYKIRLLQGFDRTKDTSLCKAIETGKRKYYSMGSLVSCFVDSITGEIEGQPGSLTLKYPRGSVINNHLLYSLCVGACFIENSSVGEPADPSAEGIIF